MMIVASQKSRISIIQQVFCFGLRLRQR